MNPPEWRVIGEDPSGRSRYRVEGVAGPDGTCARIAFEALPNVDVQGLYPDVPSAMAAAVAEAERILSN